MQTSSERHAVGFGSKRPVDGCVKREENPHGENSLGFFIKTQNKKPTGYMVGFYVLHKMTSSFLKAYW